MGLNVILPLVGGLAVVAVLIVVVLMKNRTAYLGPVKEELQKEKTWLRRGEYNAAMVKGRQNLELLLKLVAEKNGIQLDNSAKAQADAREEEERRGRNGRRKTPKVMTYHQFNRWLSENGYLDRVARWEMNQVRLIGNKAAHENYSDKDDAWNQFNYLEDILKTITERSQNPKKRQEKVKQNEKQTVKQAVEPPVQEETEQAAKKKKRRRKKKSGQKQQEVQEVKAPVVAEAPQPKQKKKVQPENSQPEMSKQEIAQPEAEAEKKKPKRRRRRKKPQNPQVQTETVKQPESKKPEPKQPEPKKSEPKKTESQKSEPKKPVTEKDTAALNDGEKQSNPHKRRRRRRRPRKPQEAQGQNLPENENEIV